MLFGHLMQILDAIVPITASHARRWREAHPLPPNVPDAVVVFQQATADQLQPIKRVDQRLAQARVTGERPDAQLRAGDRQVERRPALRHEPNVDHCRQRRDQAARDPVRARLVRVGLDVRRDQRVNSLGPRQNAASLQRESTQTLAVSVENKMLLVPLSKIIVRLVFRTDVVLPFTDIPGESSCHVLPDPDGREAKTGVPISGTRLTELACGKAVQEAPGQLTSEFSGVGATECELGVADSLWRHVQAEQRCRKFKISLRGPATCSDPTW